MTKQELKDEARSGEGNPEIKARVRRIQREMFRKRMLQAVPRATVVLTNPTHYAIAIKYEMGMKAPIVKAKGEGIVAIAIKSMAADLDIPMFEDVELARALYPVVELDKEIPAEFYVASAQILAQVRPPPWLPAKSAFFLVMVCGRIARSTVLESISIRPSLRKRSRAMRLDVA